MAVYQAHAYRLVICGIPIKCQESLFSCRGCPFNNSCVPLNVHSRHPKRSYLISIFFLPSFIFNKSAYKLGCSGVQNRKPSSGTGISIVIFFSERASTFIAILFELSTCCPRLHVGTGAVLTSVPARLFHSFTIACNERLAQRLFVFINVISNCSFFLLTKGFTKISLM